MKKIIAILLICFFANVVAKAQYVNIPDTNFRNFLIQKYPTCFNSAKQMDTTCSANLGVAQFDCFGHNITNLDGLQYFGRIEQLDCSNNNLTSLPNLPSSLFYLECGNNPNLSCLPLLHNGFQYLGTSGTNIKCMPNAVLPRLNNSLTMNPALPLCNNSNNINGCTIYSNPYVYIQDDSLRNYLHNKIPSALDSYFWDLDTTSNLVINEDSLTKSIYIKPITNTSKILNYFKNLIYLKCFAEGDTLPELPNTIKYLDFSMLSTFNYFKKLPDSLQYLKAGQIQLKALPKLPSQLRVMDISYNLLDTLPTLPPSLRSLDCTANPNLVNLPTLNSGLEDLACVFNNITSLPPLPNTLKSLDCSNTNISCLPLLPSSLTHLIVFSTNLNCLPNNPSGLVVVGATLQICNATNNPNNCPVYPTNYVNIPDTNFGKFLLVSYPSCLYKDANNLYWMDTTCSGVVNIHYMDCSNRGIADLTGVQYFKNLIYFNCNNNQLTVLPNLPNTLEGLICSYNQFASLSSLPNGLGYLDCSHNQLTSLSASNMQPAFYNNYYFVIYCQNNLLSSITIPNGINVLDCSHNNLAAIPALYIASQYHNDAKLDFSYNHLTSVPVITGNAFSAASNLNISHNNITTINGLHNIYSTVNCSNNAATTIQIDSLVGLEMLRCDSNLLTSLPLPYKADSGLNIICYNNNINCLPRLIDHIYSIQLDTNKILCLPNYSKPYYGVGTYPTVYSSTGNQINMDVCNPAINANQCVVFPLVKGKVFTDVNLNGIKDANEFYRPYVMVGLNNNKDDSTYTWTNNSGAYIMNANDTGNYTVKATNYFWNWNWWWYYNPNLFKPNPDSINLNFSNNYSNITLADIAIQPIITKDSVHISFTNYNHWAKPNGYIWNWLQWDNWGTTKLNATITVVYDSSRIDTVYSYMPMTSHIGNVITYTLDTLQVGQWSYNWLNFHVKTTVTLGDSIFATAYLTTSTVADSSKNSTLVVASYDPNDKEATPALSTTQVANGDLIDYTIRFQNTGTATATNIVVKDSISSLLQNNYLVMDATSHNTTKITLSNGVLYFEFLGINLPDSGTNQQASHGFIRFKLRPISTATLGTIIPNKAFIYFDYNSPVITNVANTIIKNIITPVTLTDYRLQLTENAANEKRVMNEWITANEINASHFNIQRSTTGNEFKTIGQVAAKGNGNYNYVDNQLPANKLTLYYRLQIIDKDGSFTYSPVKQIHLTDKQPLIKIYPNPAKDFVNINGKNIKQIKIINQLGVTVQQLNNVTEHQTINTKQLAKGIYVVQIVLNDGSIVNEKLIVE